MAAKILIGRDYLPQVLRLVEAAKKSIYIIIFDWKLYAKPHITKEVMLITAVQAARQRGVDIKVIANNDYLQAELAQIGIKAKRCKFYKIVHAKLIIIDEKIVVLGSHNFTNTAFDRNLEISAQIEEPDNTKILLDYFNSLWG